MVPGGDAHAGRTETSILLELDPTVVRTDAAQIGNTAPLRELLPALRRGGVTAVSRNGVLGDPTAASAEEGRRDGLGDRRRARHGRRAVGRGRRHGTPDLSPSAQHRRADPPCSPARGRIGRMTGPLAGDDLLARAEAALAVALTDALGIEFVDPSAPLDGVVLPVAGLAVTPAATAHGAALGAAIELAGYLAVLPTLTASQHAVTHRDLDAVPAPGARRPAGRRGRPPGEAGPGRSRA